MQREIELKLAIRPELAAVLVQKLDAYPTLSQNDDWLGNTYYDTADRYFARHHAGLRVRRCNDRFTLTLKTAGQVQGGLHIRPEYNLELADERPNLAALMAVSPLPIDEHLILQPVFATDFHRHSRLIAYENAEIDIAFDKGNIQANGKAEPISELELELKTGSTAALFRFTAELLAVFGGRSGIRFSAASKAERGYRLAAGKTPVPSDWISPWRRLAELTEEGHAKTSPELTALFVLKLFALEQRLTEETFALGETFFAADFLRTVERIGAFFNLYYFYDEHRHLLDAAVQALPPDSGLPQTLGEQIVKLNADMLAACKDLIRFHSEQKDNAAAIARLFALLQQGRCAERTAALTALVFFSGAAEK